MRFVDHPADADAVLWLVWDFALCHASGTRLLKWEIGKTRLTASCPAHTALLHALQQTPRWQRHNGRDFVFIVNDPSRWQHMLGEDVSDTGQSAYFEQLSKTRWGSVQQARAAARVLGKITSNAVLLSTEDRRSDDAVRCKR